MQMQRLDRANPVHNALRAINATRGYGDIIAVDMPTDSLPGHVLIVRPYMRDTLRQFGLFQDARGYRLTYCSTSRRIKL